MEIPSDTKNAECASGFLGGAEGGVLEDRSDLRTVSSEIAT